MIQKKTPPLFSQTTHPTPHPSSLTHVRKTGLGEDPKEGTLGLREYSATRTPTKAPSVCRDQIAMSGPVVVMHRDDTRWTSLADCQSQRGPLLSCRMNLYHDRRKGVKLGRWRQPAHPRPDRETGTPVVVGDATTEAEVTAMRTSA